MGSFEHVICHALSAWVRSYAMWTPADVGVLSTVLGRMPVLGCTQVAAVRAFTVYVNHLGS
jgi:hypothetical protein